MKIKKHIYNISQKTGDKLGFDLPYFIENGFWAVSGHIISTLLGLIVPASFAYFAPQEIFGQYQFILSTLTIVSIVSIPGLNTAVLQAVSRKFDGSYKKAVKLSFKWSFIGTPVLSAVGLYYLNSENALAISFFASAIFFPYLYSFNTWSSFLSGKTRFDLKTKWNVLSNILFTLIMVCSILFFSDNLLLIILCYLVVKSSINVIFYKKSLKLVNNKNKDEETFSYGLYMTKINAFGIILNQIDKIVIGIIDIKLLGVYVIALKLLELIKGLIKSFYQVTLPKFATKKISVSNYTYLWLITTGILISLTFYFISDKLIETIFSAKYNESSIILKKIIWVTILFLPLTHLMNKALGEKNKKILSYTQVWVPVITMVCSFTTIILRNRIDEFVLVQIYLPRILSFFIAYYLTRKTAIK